MSPKARSFWPLVFLLVLADCSSKRWAEEVLSGAPVPQDLIGNVLRLTLTYNPGAAFSTSLGEYSRFIFGGFAVLVTLFMYRHYRASQPTDTWMGAALGLIIGGALGNLVDRIISDRGVVDFLDMGLGSTRLWICNIADVGVTLGALLFFFLMWRRQPEAAHDHDRLR